MKSKVYIECPVPPVRYIVSVSNGHFSIFIVHFFIFLVQYGDVPDTLSQLIHAAFKANPRYKYIVSDFSAIEVRALSYLAKEKWYADVFNKNGDIYCASASVMFGVPVEKRGQNAQLRQKGKSCGGSVGALKAMDALEM